MVNNIDIKEMKKLWCKDTVIVDALAEHAHKKDRIPGSINIPPDKIEDVAPVVLPDKTQKIIVYCANKECQASPKAAGKLEELGYENVYDFEGGLAEWNEKCGDKDCGEDCGCGGKKMDGDGNGCC